MASRFLTPILKKFRASGLRYRLRELILSKSLFLLDTWTDVADETPDVNYDLTYRNAELNDWIVGGIHVSTHGGKWVFGTAKNPLDDLKKEKKASERQIAGRHASRWVGIFEEHNF